MKNVSGRGIFAAPRMAVLAAAAILAVPTMLYIQSSRDDKGTRKGLSRHEIAMANNALVTLAVHPRNPQRDDALLMYVGNLIEYGYRTAPRTWLKYGAERGNSAPLMLCYAAAIEKDDPAGAARWRMWAQQSMTQNKRADR